MSSIRNIWLFNIFAAPKDVLITGKHYTDENRFTNMVHITILLGPCVSENILALAQYDVVESSTTFHHEFLVEYNSRK